MRLCARRWAIRRISWIDQRMRLEFVLRLFFWGRPVCLMSDGRHHGEGEHDQRDVTMPAMPGSGLVVVEPELVLGGLEAILDCPAMTFDTDQCLNRCSRRTPGGEVGEIAIGDIASDQQAARPQTMVFIVELFGFKVGQLEVAPVMQARAFGSGTCRQALPIGWRQGLGDVFS